MTSLRQIAVYGVLGVIVAALVFWWLTEDGAETLDAEQDETGGLVRHEKTERSMVVGVSSLSSMVKVNPTGAEKECRHMTVGEKLQTLGEGARAAPALAARPTEDAGAPSSALRTEVADRRPENRRIESVRHELSMKRETPVPRQEVEESLTRCLEKNEAPAFVPHEPTGLPAERTRWHPVLKSLGVKTWTYRVVRISEHAYRVNAFFAFEDGRTFMYSTTTLNGYPAAPVLVQEWLANNPCKEA